MSTIWHICVRSIALASNTPFLNYNICIRIYRHRNITVLTGKSFWHIGTITLYMRVRPYGSLNLLQNHVQNYTDPSATTGLFLLYIEWPNKIVIDRYRCITYRIKLSIRIPNKTELHLTARASTPMERDWCQALPKTTYDVGHEQLCAIQVLRKG